ncbi:MAG: glycoside hydrolase family 32 protein, partial [Kiritimatiellales bacterium]|nr:glycoside hydrolase family 32 protein [Kiritimatiellales bacterium]
VDVSDVLGKNAKIVIFDSAKGGWGHINADNFTMSEKPVVAATKPLEPKKNLHATMKIDKKYIIIPIDNDGSHKELSLKLNGKDVRFLTGGFAESEDRVNWWAFIDLSEYKGQELELFVNNTSDHAFGLITQSDRVPGEDRWGTEPKRPQFHFSQKVGWNNDPNGMVYYKGWWHMYFQHNPVGLPWGNMTWGHAVSKDLVHWKQMPDALHHQRGDAMFSGGGAVDWKNTGGWKKGVNDVIIATWTSTGRGECIAYSHDQGRTFSEYEGNPVIRHGGRDPKPFWYDYVHGDKPLNETAKKLGGHWVIAVFDTKGGNNIAFYTSTDLKKWTEQSHLQGYYECAEVFQLPVDGDKKDTRWVVFAADARYAIGHFDGTAFTPETAKKFQLHWGPYYASQCFSDAPDGRVVQVGWARLDMGNTCFNQTFSFPTELTLRRTEKGVRMFGEPVKEIKNIHGKKHTKKNITLTDGHGAEVKPRGALFDIRATFEPGTAKSLGLLVDGEELFAFDCVSGTFNGKKLLLDDGKLSVQILIDRPMKETFVNNGEMILTSGYNNDLDIESVNAIAKGGEAKLVFTGSL